MTTELTDDEHLRALAALEAISGNKADTLAVLAGGPGERPLPALLAAYGEHTIHRVLLAAFGIDATTGRDEFGRLLAELNGDPQAQLAFVLITTLREQAALAGNDPAAARVIGSAILGAVNAFTEDHDTLALLRALRRQVLQVD
ncbi:hypothetical protein ACFV0Y_16575 [Streptomyces sp. NPDC059569]|uniref:hypothetical protein n=1 Tax=Streptomyces sp. NPDC059569 TaxID=3346869 RepID=UPI0036803342